MVDEKLVQKVERRLLLNPGDLPWLPRALEIYEEEKEEQKEKEKMDLHRDSLLGRGLLEKKEKNAKNGLLTTAGEKPAYEDNGWFPGDCCD